MLPYLLNNSFNSKFTWQKWKLLLSFIRLSSIDIPSNYRQPTNYPNSSTISSNISNFNNQKKSVFNTLAVDLYAAMLILRNRKSDLHKFFKNLLNFFYVIFFWSRTLENPKTTGRFTKIRSIRKIKMFGKTKVLF